MGFTNQAEAALFEWTGFNDDTNWFVSNNWSNPGLPDIPGSSDDVLIGSNFVPSNWPFLTASTVVRSVAVQAPTPFVAGNFALTSGQLTVLDDFNVGVGSNGTVILQQSNAILSVSGQIIVGSGGILDNKSGSIEQFNSQPIIIRHIYNQVISSSAQLGTNTLRVESGGTVRHSKGLISITSLLTINGGNDAFYSLLGTGNLEVPTINIGGSGAGTLLIAGSAQLTQTNIINVLSNGLFDIKRDFDYAGTLSLDNTTVKVNNGATAKTLTVILSGLLRGTGTVDGNLINDANVDPGLGFVGSFTITEDYEQTGLGTFFVDLAGTASNSFDRLNVTGDISLNGELEIQLVSSFVPIIGNSFDIIAFGGSHVGAFSSVAFPTISSGIALGLIYDTNAVSLVTGLQGDLNGDGFVGIDDLNIVLVQWNQNVTAGIWSSGDASGDGFVGVDDLNAVLGNWNAGTPPAALVTVPEPAGIVWLCLGAMGLLRNGRLIRPRNS